MAKKTFSVLVLAMVIAGGAFAQEKTANSKDNWISAEISLLGIGARYERMLGEKISVGADAYWSSLFFLWNELEAGVFGRFYPWGKTFFLELGLGYHTHTAVTLAADGVEGEAISGLAISPSLGWKIDVGNPGGFFISPGIKLPISLGPNASTVDNEFGVGVGFVPYFGLGGAF